MRKCLSCLKAFVTSLKNERVKSILRGFEEKRGIFIPLFFIVFSLSSPFKKRGNKIPQKLSIYSENYFTPKM